LRRAVEAVSTLEEGGIVEDGHEKAVEKFIGAE